MAYLLCNIFTKNYWNPTTIIEIIVGGWVVFETQCRCGLDLHRPTRRGKFQGERGPARHMHGHVQRSIYSKRLSRGQNRCVAGAD